MPDGDHVQVRVEMLVVRVTGQRDGDQQAGGENRGPAQDQAAAAPRRPDPATAATTLARHTASRLGRLLGGRTLSGRTQRGAPVMWPVISPQVIRSAPELSRECHSNSLY